LFQISKLFSFREKIIAASLVVLVLAAFIFWVGYLYVNLTKAVPKKGGQYVEGIIGQPMYINPLLSQASEADADLAQLIYGGLFKYDGQGNIEPDLAENYEISEDQKSYTVHIKKNVKWHDGESLAADDVLFTIRALQDPAYKSPLRQSWQGVEAEQIDDYTIKFTLKNPYFGFIDSLTIEILPKHIWENIVPEKFTLSEYNLRPIGSGPYEFINFQKDSSGNIISYELRAFPQYFSGEAYITNLNFNFYSDDDSLLNAFNKKEVDGMGNVAPEKNDDIKSAKSTIVHDLSMPRYFAVFLNQTKDVALADDKVREALAYGTNREEIINRVLGGKGIAMFSPFLPQMKGYEDEIDRYNFDQDKSKSILEEDGWKEGASGIREKDGKKLGFELLTLDWPQLNQTSDILIEQWKKIGIDVRVNVLSVSDLQQNFIRPREYSALLFGQAMNFNPDPYSFWHSSQKRDPGLNLALFDDKKADDLLDSARQETNEQKRIDNYKEFQKIVSKEIPAIFLYSPNYFYPVNQKVQGIDAQNINAPSWRFADVNKWYVKTKRVRK
jgi:peptide/nickel transport system substrate-binding protein